MLGWDFRRFEILFENIFCKTATETVPFFCIYMSHDTFVCRNWLHDIASVTRGPIASYYDAIGG